MIDFQLNKVDGTTTNDEVELILQQIDILFDTDPMEVLGESKFGTNYEKFLYETYYSNSYIQSYISHDIQTNIDLMGWDLDVKVEILNGSENDIILVSITLSNDTLSYKQNYKIR